jgi:hypothetical protein
MTFSDWGNLATCIGAALGAAAFVWDVKKHLSSGPKLKVRGWYHQDPHSPRVLVRVEVRNHGDVSTRVERIVVEQDGRRFDVDDHLTIDPDGGPVRFQRNEVAPNDYVLYEVSPFNRAKEEPPTPVRLPDSSRPALVYVRASAFEKEVVGKVKPRPREA